PPTTQTSPTPTPVPTPTAQPLASLTSSASGSPVDGMQCASSEPTTNRFTAHLAVFVGGSARQIPAGVGIASPSPPIDTNAGPFVASGKCYYPLLTHTSDGIVQTSYAAFCLKKKNRPLRRPHRRRLHRPRSPLSRRVDLGA